MTKTATEPKPETLDALAPYNEVRASIEQFKTENAGLSFDYADPKGNKAARSHIYNLRKLKADVDRKRKALGADALAYKKEVDAVGKDLIGEVEGMIDVHQKPLDEIEQREEARKEALRERMAELAMPEEIIADSNTAREIATRINAIEIDESWQDFKTEAEATKAATVTALKQRFGQLKKQEDESAELERLRQQVAEREEKDRAEAKQREAEQRERDEAEERSRREAQIREETAQRIREEAEHARAEAEAKAKAEREAEAEKAMAEARRKEAEAQAAIEAEREKARQAEREAERVKREAEEAERKRAEEAKRQQEEEDRRKADRKHREKIMSEAAKPLVDLCMSAEGIEPEDFAAQIVLMIANGEVPHTSIQF